MIEWEPTREKYNVNFSMAMQQDECNDSYMLVHLING